MRVLAVAVPFAVALSLPAQQTPIRPPGYQPAAVTLEPLGQNIWRSSGLDPWSGVKYVRLLLVAAAPSTPEPAAATQSGPDLSQPTLIAQCTREGNGKPHFELFVNFGGVADTGFYPPWHSTAQDDLFPPTPPRVNLVLDFLGYTHIRPFKRQFEAVLAPAGSNQLRYLTPGGSSANMEPPVWFFQYLRSLPTLRLTLGRQTADFPAAFWLIQLHRDPLCIAAGA